MSRSLLLLWLLAGCPSDPPRCYEVTPRECDSLLPPPTIAELHEDILARSCANASVSCHGGHTDNSLRYGDAAEAEGALAPFLEGGITCSELAARVTSDDPFFRMPPVTPLTLEQQCEVLRYIEANAPAE